MRGTNAKYAVTGHLAPRGEFSFRSNRPNDPNFFGTKESRRNQVEEMLQVYKITSWTRKFSNTARTNSIEFHFHQFFY